MAPELMLQIGILILILSLSFLLYNLRKQKTLARTQTRNRFNNRHPEPTHHLAQASRLLARTKPSHQHATSALVEAQRVLSIVPRDPSAHIIRARALRLIGHRIAALRSLNSALSSPSVNSLSAAAHAEALVMRAELKVEVNLQQQVDSAVEDLVEAIGLSGEDGVKSEALCLLGKCYEWKGMKEEAEKAFQKVLDVEPESVEARDGLGRLGL